MQEERLMAQGRGKAGSRVVVPLRSVAEIVLCCVVAAGLER